MTTRLNPYADFVRDDMSAEDLALVGQIGALDEHDDPAVVPDPAYLAQGRCEVLAATAIATLLAAPNRATPDVYIDPDLCTSSWLNALADELYSGGAQ